MNGNLTICPSCGTTCPQGINFCPNCGSKLQAAPPSLPAEKQRTPAATANPPDFITLSCPNCGGKLQITPDIERFACQYCGYEHIVRRSGGAVLLEPVMKMMNHINTNIDQVGAGVNHITLGVEKQASEAAIVRLKQEIDDLIKVIAAIESGSRTVWFVDAVIGAVAVFGWVASSAENGVNSSLENTFYMVGGGATFFLAVMFIATIASTINSHKMIKQKENLIDQKRQELNAHYQVVSRKE